MTDDPHTAPNANDGHDGPDEHSSDDTLINPADPSALRPSGKRSHKYRDQFHDAEITASSDEGSIDTTDTDQSTKKKKKSSAKTTQISTSNPFLFVYIYLKQVVLELRKVIWPSRKQMMTYTGVVLAFLIFMVILVAVSDFGFAKLVMLVFGA